jgi:hypothetical protein
MPSRSAQSGFASDGDEVVVVAPQARPAARVGEQREGREVGEVPAVVEHEHGLQAAVRDEDLPSVEGELGHRHAGTAVMATRRNVMRTSFGNVGRRYP